ncbi:hypothetical protein HK105_204059 [Polyrhizophydium stewartii]|uniref:Proteasome maturation protein n=1 Tax=Polyrhizophydium stewartii TaxID=2732419 RepID=A0ABR4N9U3_9FUNG|nr:hypothetical protein HK105_008356 [Polyrhizophydium stewartii]
MGKGTEYGTHDTLRDGLRTVRSMTAKGHPLESHLESWDVTQDALKLNMARSAFGVHLPLRIQMERALVKQHVHAIPVLPQRNLALDVLNGKLDTIEFEDFLGDVRTPTNMLDPHTAMEQVLRM